MSGDSEEARREERLTAPQRYRAREADLLLALAWKVVKDPAETVATREAAQRRLDGADDVDLERLSEPQLELLERVLAHGRGELTPAEVGRLARRIADAVDPPAPAPPCERCRERDAAEAALTPAQRRAIELVAAGAVELDPATLPPA